MPTTKVTRKTASRKPDSDRPEKPYEDFPRFAHATGRRAKKVRGKLVYFGPWADPLAALIDDLAQRGLLDETLVVATGEFGRTPKINSVAGRDHWPDAFSVLLAGAGLPGGAYYGATDKQGAHPFDRPISPARLAATIFHALGIGPQLERSTTLGRPFRRSP